MNPAASFSKTTVKIDRNGIAHADITPLSPGYVPTINYLRADQLTTAQSNTQYVVFGSYNSPAKLLLVGLTDVVFDMTAATFARGSASGAVIEFQNCTRIIVRELRITQSDATAITFNNSTYCKLDGFVFNDWNVNAILCYNGSSYNVFTNGTCSGLAGGGTHNGILHVDCHGCRTSNIYMANVIYTDPAHGPNIALQCKNNCVAVAYSNCTVERCTNVTSFGSDDSLKGCTNCSFTGIVANYCDQFCQEFGAASLNRCSGTATLKTASNQWCLRLQGIYSSYDVTLSSPDVTRPLVQLSSTAANNLVRIQASTANVIYDADPASSANIIQYVGPADRLSHYGSAGNTAQVVMMDPSLQ